MSNLDDFLSVFSDIERHLRTMTRSGREVTFSTLIESAARGSPSVRRYRDDLKEYGDLRNAVVHERRGGTPIAEPNDWAVAQLRGIAEQLIRPPKVWPHFQAEVFTLQPTDPIAAAVTVMHEQSFSQIPIYTGQTFVGLLTSNTVTRWLGANVSEDLVSLSETPISAVLTHTEFKEHVDFVGRDTLLVEVVERFQREQEQGRRLDALLMTQNGKATERLLGIITVYDMVKVNDLLTA